jgi:ABC-type antimicrobial peptide transport system permease subunit
LFQVSPTDATSFGLGLLLLGPASLVAAALPAWRATRIDPARALRWE